MKNLIPPLPPHEPKRNERGEIVKPPSEQKRPSWGNSLACASVFFSLASIFAAKIVSPLLWATGGSLAMAAMFRHDGEGGDGCLVYGFAIFGLVLCAVGACAFIFM